MGLGHPHDQRQLVVLKPLKPRVADEFAVAHDQLDAFAAEQGHAVREQSGAVRSAALELLLQLSSNCQHSGMWPSPAPAVTNRTLTWHWPKSHSVRCKHRLSLPCAGYKLINN